MILKIRRIKILNCQIVLGIKNKELQRRLKEHASLAKIIVYCKSDEMSDNH